MFLQNYNYLLNNLTFRLNGKQFKERDLKIEFGHGGNRKPYEFGGNYIRDDMHHRGKDSPLMKSQSNIL